jgi:hypothetical protein
MKKILLALSILLALTLFPMRVQAQSEHLTVTDASCTTAAPCSLQLYRALLATGQTTCPAAGDSSYTEITNALVGTAGAASTTWTYSDAVGAPPSFIAMGSTYCYYATATYTSGGIASLPSVVYQAAIPNSQPTSPATITGIFQSIG